MKRLFETWGVVAIAVLLGVLGASADTGHEGATRREEGTYAESRQISVTTHTATQILGASTKRPGIICKNFSDYIIFVGSAAAGTTLDTVGLPIASSGTLTLGSYTGTLHALAEGVAGGDVQVRCLDQLVR